MKVLLVGKSAKYGGAAIASFRLMEALQGSGIEVNMLVQECGDCPETIFSTTGSVLKRGMNFLRFVIERLFFLRYERSKEVRFLFSPANTGESLVRNRHVREADIIHLQWINGGFLSLSSLKGLFELGKPIVWTFHDMWAITGGCHHALTCNNYKETCGECPYLKRPGRKDLSHRLWIKKNRLFKDQDITVITPSKWLHDCVRESSLFRYKDVHVIRNPVDPNSFVPVDREVACRNLHLDPSKRYILFGAASVRNLYKGLEYFLEAIKLMSQEPENIQELEIILFGKTGGDVSGMFPVVTHSFNYVDSVQMMMDLYNTADLYAISSVQDNFPGTIIESMLCGTPVVGFRTGGIPEMINHLKDGYLAEYRSAADLAKGMEWVLTYKDYNELKEAVRREAVRKFSKDHSVALHVDLYRNLANREN